MKRLWLLAPLRRGYRSLRANFDTSEALGLLLTVTAISGWTFGSLMLLDGRTGLLSLALVGLGGSLATVGVGWLTVLLHVRQIVSGTGVR